MCFFSILNLFGCWRCISKLSLSESQHLMNMIVNELGFSSTWTFLVHFYAESRTKWVACNIPDYIWLTTLHAHAMIDFVSVCSVSVGFYKIVYENLLLVLNCFDVQFKCHNVAVNNCSSIFEILCVAYNYEIKQWIEHGFSCATIIKHSRSCFLQWFKWKYSFIFSVASSPYFLNYLNRAVE